ncbi:MAG: Hsp20/alpha crystallin family protein [Desulfobia sp.]
MISRNLFNYPGLSWRAHLDELNSMRNQLNKLMGNFNRGELSLPERGVFPLVNLSENKDNYYIRAELPGIAREDLELSAVDGSIFISGERKITDEDKNATFHRRERNAGSFSRAVSLPGKIDSNKIEASMINGILEITVPKAEETKPKQIKVK